MSLWKWKGPALTSTERAVLGFLLIAFVTGLAVKYTDLRLEEEYIRFDYSEPDSMFMNASKEEASLFQEQEKKAKSAPSVKKKKKTLPAENSININKAGLQSLIQLPGIGEKTAQKILDLRKLKGKFGKIEELLEVKGIGPSKLGKIRKYVTIQE